MATDLQNTFEKASQWANAQETHFEYQKRSDLEYARSDMNTDTGRICLGHNDKTNSKLLHLKKKEEIERKIREIINRAVENFYERMASWSLTDFEANGTAYKAGLYEKAEEERRDGNDDEAERLEKIAEEFHEREQEILNDPELSEAEKRKQLEDLWRDQPQDLVEEFIMKYHNASEVAINKDKGIDQIALNQEEGKQIDYVETTSIPGLGKVS